MAEPAPAAEEVPEHKQLMLAAVECEHVGHLALLGGEWARAESAMGAAVGLWRRSWEVAPPESWGRLIGMLKAAIIAGDHAAAATYAEGQLGESASSAAGWYPIGIAAALRGDDEITLRAAEGMRVGAVETPNPGAFERAADGLSAIATGDRTALRAAVEAIAGDFSTREEHLTGVPIADTALMLERIASARGMGPTGVRSPLLPS